MAAAMARAIGTAAVSPIALMPKRFVAGSSFTPTRYWANGSSEPRPTKMAPLFRGIDYEHWVVLMDKPIVHYYVGTLAKVVGSEVEAHRRIYKVSCEGYFGFGCKIDRETTKKLTGLPGVLAVLPDPEYNYCEEDVEGKLGVMRKRINQLLADLERLKKVTARHSARHYSNASFWWFYV